MDNEHMDRLKHYLSNFYKNHQNLTNIFLLVVLTFVVFYNSLGNYYLAADDFNNLLHSKRNFFETFITNTYGQNSGGDYRPIEVLSHQFDKYLYGDDNPFGRRLTNLIIHIFNVILVYLLGSFLTKKKSIGLIAGLFFAVHLIHGYSHSQPVTWISGRVEVFLVFFYLLTIILFLRFLSNGSKLIYMCSFVTFLLALMSKEMAATLPLIVLLYLLLWGESPKGVGILNPILWSFLIIGVLLVIFGFLITPSFVADFMSSDGKIEQRTIDRIHYSQNIAIIGGGILIVMVSGILIFNNLLKKSTKLSTLRYSIPYFLVLILYLILRFIILQGFGGHYQSGAGSNLIIYSGIDSFARDIYALAGLIWLRGDQYVVDIYQLYAKNIFIFYTIAIALLIGLIFIIYKLITSQSKPLIFNTLWIFITLLPVHNFILNHGGYNSRYLYLPLVGFCISASMILQKVTTIKNIPERFSKTLIVLFILLTLSGSSYLIIRNNNELRNCGKIMEKIVSDLKRYRSQVSNTTNIYFITSPINLVVEGTKPILSYRSNIEVILRMKMDEILNFASDDESYEKHFSYNFILFVQGEEKDQINLNWINEKTFTISNINLSNYYLITKKIPLVDKHYTEMNKSEYPQSVLQSFTSEGEVKESDIAVIEVLEFDKKSNAAKLKVELKDQMNNSLRNNVFFLYNKGHFKLLNSF